MFVRGSRNTVAKKCMLTRQWWYTFNPSTTEAGGFLEFEASLVEF